MSRDIVIVKNVELGELNILRHRKSSYENLYTTHMYTCIHIHMYMYTNYNLIFDTEDEFICRFINPKYSALRSLHFSLWQRPLKVSRFGFIWWHFNPFISNFYRPAWIGKTFQFNPFISKFYRHAWGILWRIIQNSFENSWKRHRILKKKEDLCAHDDGESWIWRGWMSKLFPIHTGR